MPRKLESIAPVRPHARTRFIIRSIRNLEQDMFYKGWKLVRDYSQKHRKPGSWTYFAQNPQGEQHGPFTRDEALAFWQERYSNDSVIRRTSYDHYR